MEKERYISNNSLKRSVKQDLEWILIAVRKRPKVKQFDKGGKLLADKQRISFGRTRISSVWRQWSTYQNERLYAISSGNIPEYVKT